jgi:hypothetical protein
MAVGVRAWIAVNKQVVRCGAWNSEVLHDLVAESLGETTARVKRERAV